MSGKHAQIVLGPAGSGKSTYVRAIYEHCEALKRTVHCVNLDPAAEVFGYPCAVDIRELVTVDDVQEELDFGPNGALVYAIEYAASNLDWLEEEIGDHDDDYLLLDCPGQTELFLHVDAFKSIVSTLQRWGYSVCAVFLLDSQFMAEPTKFISGALMALSAMCRLELPHINVLSKMDLAKRGRMGTGTGILAGLKETSLMAPLAGGIAQSGAHERGGAPDGAVAAAAAAVAAEGSGSSTGAGAEAGAKPTAAEAAEAAASVAVAAAIAAGHGSAAAAVAASAAAQSAVVGAVVDPPKFPAGSMPSDYPATRPGPGEGQSAKVAEAAAATRRARTDPLSGGGGGAGGDDDGDEAMDAASAAAAAAAADDASVDSSDGEMEKFLTPDVDLLLHGLNEATPPRFAALNDAIGQLLDEYSMVHFVPLDITSEDSIAFVLSMADNAIQFGEDAEPKTVDFDDLGGAGGDELPDGAESFVMGGGAGGA